MPLTSRLLTGAALALALLAVAACSQPDGVVIVVSEQKDEQEQPEQPKSEEAKASKEDKAEKEQPNGKRSVPMFGGSLSRNMVNLIEKGLVQDFAPDVRDKKLNPKGEAKNLKWKQKLGGH